MKKLELYSEQDSETKVIVPYLKKLGYDEGDQTKDIVLKFQHTITVHQGREQKSIRADIVVYVHAEPIMVIDSKNPRQFLTDNDREQVISYARLIGNIAPYAALCNGYTWQVYDTITKQLLPDLPRYDDLLSDQQRRRVSHRQRESLVEQATQTLFAIDSARELSRLMRRCHDIIRNLKGFDPTKAFDELSKLLFCKMYEEREVATGRRQENRFSTDVVDRMRKNGVEIIQTLWTDTITSDGGGFAAVQEFIEVSQAAQLFRSFFLLARRVAGGYCPHTGDGAFASRNGWRSRLWSRELRSRVLSSAVVARTPQFRNLLKWKVS